ncbi:alpha/beta fold hydrolase [Rubrobacter tropicus]|uniref:alpha/beta fold hydrolase n=1 Tax=Rubrobacter tropicus TaxID=2653851 RepID=UPI00140C1DA8|nr:alpha/beta fold hydrolase [Rubrobacter tropicus]
MAAEPQATAPGAKPRDGFAPSARDAPKSVSLRHEVEGEGETVLLLHPVGLDLTWCGPLAERLRPHFRVLRVDLRGHGGSPVPPGPWRIEDLAADVHALLGATRLGPAHVVGLLLGGMVAQVLAIDHPDDVRSLVLSGTACTFAPSVREALAARGAAAEDCGMQAVVRPTLERWFTPGFLGSELVERCRQRLLSDNVAGWAATWRAISVFDALPRLREISVPSLVAAGSVDTSTPPEVARTIAEAIPGATLHTMPGAPHMAPFERPDLFDPLVLTFLRGLKTRPL